MKFSENWLREFVPIKADRAELCQRLTMAGLEVEAIEPLGESLDGVVVAQIIDCEPHPNADKLRVCQVSIGADEPVQIVCGAPNARAGLKAPLATVDATLPNGIQIKKAALRGVESSGMLCSAKELGIDADASGLLELPDDAPGRPSACPISTSARCGDRNQAHPESPGLSVGAGFGARCRGHFRRDRGTACDRTDRSDDRVRAQSTTRCRCRLPALLRPPDRGHRRGRANAAVDGRTPAPLGLAPDQPARRRVQLRAARTRSAAARDSMRRP